MSVFSPSFISLSLSLSSFFPLFQFYVYCLFVCLSYSNFLYLSPSLTLSLFFLSFTSLSLVFFYVFFSLSLFLSFIISFIDTFSVIMQTPFSGQMMSGFPFPVEMCLYGRKDSFSFCGQCIIKTLGFFASVFGISHKINYHIGKGC